MAKKDKNSGPHRTIDSSVDVDGDGNYIATTLFSIPTREGEELKLGQGDHEAIMFAVNRANSYDRDRAFFSLNPGGNGPENLRIIFNDHPGLSIYVARIVLNASPGQKLRRLSDDRLDYRRESLALIGGSSTVQTRQLLIDTTCAVVASREDEARTERFRKELERRFVIADGLAGVGVTITVEAG